MKIFLRSIDNIYTREGVRWLKRITIVRMEFFCRFDKWFNEKI